MFFATQPRLSDRALADVAVVSVPTTLKSPVGLSEKLKPPFEAGYNGEELGRLTFTSRAAGVSATNSGSSCRPAP